MLEAVAETIKDLAPEAEVKGIKTDGLANCRTMLLQLNAGKLDANIMEGMSCIGGCVGGPGTIMDARVTSKLVDNFAKTVNYDMASKNEVAKKEVQEVDMHRK